MIAFTFIWYIVLSYSAMDGCTANNFVKRVKKKIQVGVVCGAWWHLQELSQQSNNSCIHMHKLKTWTKTVLTCFTKNYCWAAIPDPTTNVTLWKNNKMLSSTNNNFMIFLFDLRDLVLNLCFLFFLLTLYNLLQKIQTFLCLQWNWFLKSV